MLVVVTGVEEYRAMPVVLVGKYCLFVDDTEAGMEECKVLHKIPSLGYLEAFEDAVCNVMEGATTETCAILIFVFVAEGAIAELAVASNVLDVDGFMVGSALPRLKKPSMALPKSSASTMLPLRSSQTTVSGPATSSAKDTFWLLLEAMGWWR